MAVYNHPAVKEDLGRWNATLLMPSPLPQYNLAGIGKPPRNLFSMRKLNVRATGGIAESMKVLKANPVSMSATEVRGALNDGSIEAVAFAPHAHMAFGVADRADWWTANLNPGTVNCPVVANTDALNALSKEHRAALLSSIDEALEHYLDNYSSVTMAAWGPLLEKNGIEEVELNQTALNTLRDAALKSTIEPWIEEQTKRGVPAKALLDFVRSNIDGAS